MPKCIYIVQLFLQKSSEHALGVLVFIMGLILSGWVVYNLFIERLPESRGISPKPAIVLSAAFLYVGYKWMRSEQA